MNLSSLINLLFLLSCLIILTESRVHEIATFGDGLASLPCEVDFKNCGEIYFITWSKNVSNEWQRVYSYSQGYQKALGHFSGQPNRISMDDSNMTTTGIAYLRIKNLALSDEGTYKCDVTYVHGNCPSLTYSKLFTLVKPGKPVIRINGEPLESKLLLKTDESSDISRIDVKYNPDKGKVNSNVNSGKSVNKNINESDNDSDWESTVYQVGPFTESSTLTLECSTTGGRPIPEIKWFNGTRPLRSKVNLINRETGPSVTSTIRLVVTRSDVGVKFGCSVWNNATKIPLTKWISLEIHVKPLSLKLRRPKAPVVSGEMVSLTCTVDGARPPASIVWFNRSEVVAPHPTSSTDLMSDGTYRTWSKLVFIASRYDHNGEFFCKGVNQVLKERNEVPMIEMTMLQVLYPPAVTIDPGGRIAVNESSTINLACSFDANPPNVSDIVWYKDGNLITGNDRRLPIQIDETSLTIKNVTHSHSGFYSCSLKNSFGTGNSTNHAYIDVWYPPKVSIDLRPSVIIETGKSLILQCLVSQGNPVTLTHVQWYFNGNHFETTHDPSASSLTLTNITSSHTGNYSCLGFNGARYPSPISSSKQLIVQYKPSQANLTVHYLGEMASKGVTVTLVCSLMGDSGNPPAHSFVWLHQGTLLEGVDSSSYSIKSLSVSNQGNYSCAAVNKLGEGPFSHQIIKVKGAPRSIKGLPVTMGILRNQSVTVSCQIECEPLCPIEWFINNESLGVASSSSSSSPSSSSARVTTATASSLSSDAYDTLADGYEVITEGSDESLLSSSSAFYHINFSLIKEDASSNQLASSLSYLYIKNNSWLRDNDIISCQSQTNGLGPPVKSSTIYRNEYAPERVKISISQLELLEGDKFADNLVVCSASANPSGHYHWIKGSTGQLISQGANLYFNETRINKDLRDNYTCVVTNKHGSGQAHFILNVLYRPECFIHKESLGGNRWLLSCEATSNPPVLNFTWYRYNRTVGETVSSLSSSLALSSSSAQSTSPSTVKLEFLSSGSNSFPVSSKRLASLSEDRQSSVLVLEENDLEAYSCIATNVIGTSLPCRLKQVQINAPSGWVQLLFKDENLIIVGSAFGLILFVVVFGLAIGLVFFGRRKLKSLEKSSSVQTHHHSLGRHHYDPSQANSTLHHYATQQNANHQPYQSASQLHQEQQLHPQVHHHLYNSLTRNYHNVNVNNNKNHSSSLHHYSSQKYASINQSKTSSLNKLPILEERTIPDGRCSDNNCDADDVSPYGHQRSPLITRSHQCITLGPVSSPLLLSEYLTDDNESETQITESPNSMNHYYESTSPLHRANYKNTVNSKSLNLLANTNNNSQNTFINVNNSHNSNNTHYSHTLIHEHSTNPHYNIPLTLSRHPPPLPPLPPERTHRHHANPAIYDYSRYHTNRIT